MCKRKEGKEEEEDITILPCCPCGMPRKNEKGKHARQPLYYRPIWLTSQHIHIFVSDGACARGNKKKRHTYIYGVWWLFVRGRHNPSFFIIFCWKPWLHGNSGSSSIKHTVLPYISALSLPYSCTPWHSRIAHPFLTHSLSVWDDDDFTHTHTQKEIEIERESERKKESLAPRSL